jgi:K+/H+ antiporter YhaU regulatory subunit KhtT
MCESCVVIDERIEQYRQLLRSTADSLERGRINRLIMELYVERVRLHQKSVKVGRLISGLKAERFSTEIDRQVGAIHRFGIAG